jgi:hypothetical protein
MGFDDLYNYPLLYQKDHVVGLCAWVRQFTYNITYNNNTYAIYRR